MQGVFFTRHSPFANSLPLLAFPGTAPWRVGEQAALGDQLHEPHLDHPSLIERECGSRRGSTRRCVMTKVVRPAITSSSHLQLALGRASSALSPRRG